jgi:hypothetical protein
MMRVNGETGRNTRSPEVGATAMTTCPLCFSSKVAAARRTRAIERGLLTWIGVLPFRCAECQTRFYRVAWDDPRRHRRDAADSLPVERPRAPRWPVKLPAWVYYEGPGGETVAIEGVTEDASVQGAKVRLPEPVPEGSRVEVSIEGGPRTPASVRWNRTEGDQAVVHGLGLEKAWPPESIDPAPLGRLRRRRLVRRLLIGGVIIGLIALAMWGLVALMAG